MAMYSEHAERDERDSNSLVHQAKEALIRCLIELEVGLETSPSGRLRARFLQGLPMRFSERLTETMAICFRADIFYLTINPQRFMSILTVERRLAALKHATHHLFMYHPIRAARQAIAHGPARFALFQVCSELETHAWLGSSPQSTDLETLQAHPGVSAEHLCDQLAPLWSELHGSSVSQERTESSKVRALRASLSSRGECDMRHWRELRGLMRVRMFEMELDRMLLTARESLSVSELRQLPQAERDRCEDLSKRYSLRKESYDDEQEQDLLRVAEREIERVVLRMQRIDPFFGVYLSTCLRQVSTMIPTAGVAVRQDHIVLMVNPHFFLKTLKTSEERGAILKHEALHIILGHVIQIRSERFTDKDQYNIAADLEVNQHISAPWTLPADAVTLLTFPDLMLPERRVAEEYYELLVQAQRVGQDAAPASPTNDGIPRSSDHSAWAGDNLESGRHELINPLPVYSERLKTHERDLAARLKRAVEDTPSKHHGMIPSHIFEILEKSERARRPQTDWRRELRMFLTNSRKMTRSATLRKKNKRFMTRRRLALAGHMITADAVQLLARVNVDAMPRIKWGELPAELRAEALTLRSALTSLKSTSELPWTSLPRVTVHKLMLTLPDLPWPNWGDFSDAQLSLIKVLRTPLSSTRLPLDLYIKLARDHPQLLPELSWSELGDTRHASLIDQHPHLRRCAEITWPMLPLSVLAELYHMRPELFTLSWNDLPPKILAESQMYQRQSGEVFRVERVITKSTPGFKRSPADCKILVVADTSGSMRDRDLNLIYDHLDRMTDLGLEVHVLQVDSEVQLYSKYIKSRSVRGRGGTDFNAAFEWINAARSVRGVLTPTPKDRAEREIEERYVRLTVDGVIVITDGRFSTPRVRPRCRVLWVLTSYGATDMVVSGWEHTTAVIRLPD